MFSTARVYIIYYSSRCTLSEKRSLLFSLHELDTYNISWKYILNRVLGHVTCPRTCEMYGRLLLLILLYSLKLLGLWL
jgi:hypothetical protein